ncbi:adenylyl-sulfate kinase [Massilia sp. W12]|uniref:adenylyl-sulfate kinase n=1 Tax=Massilia sp. W12 TaxID=3126507 RepID=UPI0030CA62D9
MKMDKKLTDQILEQHVSQDVTWQQSKVHAEERANLLHVEPATVWLTGLSGSGKSTLAFELERRLIAGGHLVYVLDGDNIRHGLSRDLGFSPQDRTENIRRVAEVAKLFNEAGMLIITSFISPYREDRELARAIIGRERFIETYLCTSLQVCEQRDPKGLYQKVRDGKIQEFTGISAPYEIPESPEVTLDTGRLSITESVACIMQQLTPRLH